MFYQQSIYQQSSTMKHPLGTVRWENDGRGMPRKYVYAKAGASALAAGKVMQCPIPVANHLNKAVKAAAAIGAYSVTMAIGATALTLNQYRYGTLHTNDATGEGYLYRVKNHLAYSASATNCVINLYDPIQVALVASTSEVTLTKHPYDGLIICPTTLTSTVAGVTPIAVTAAYYFWCQVKGPAAVLCRGTIVVGNGVVPDAGSSSVAGGVLAEANTAITERIGTVMQVNATTEYSLINLNVPGN